MRERILQWIFGEFPWLNDAVPWLMMLRDFWHDYQGLIVLIGFFLVWRLLRRERLKLGERIDTLAQIVRATRDEAEAAIGLPLQPPPAAFVPQPPPPQGAVPGAPAPLPPADYALPAEADSVTNWETIRLGWRDIRDRLELAIEGIRHAGVRRKYSRIPRYGYREVINTLLRDGVIKTQVADHLLNMDRTFNVLRFRPNTVTGADVSDFNRSLAFVDDELPRLPPEGGAPAE
jgi:hypothetical protein